MLTRIFSTSSRVVAQRIPGIPRANPFQATGYRYKSDVKNEDAVKDVNEVDQLGPCPVKFEDITRAHYRIASGIIRSHCDESRYLSELTKCTVFMKQDFIQFTGSFKERGARNALLSLTPEQRQKGVVAASAGNHALALAWHGKLLGIPVYCVMPKTAPMTKVSKCKRFGGTVILHGDHIEEAKQFAKQEFPEYTYINGYDDHAIISGAGTMGIEIMEQVKDVDVVVVPVGGAGLIAGVSLAIKSINPNVEVIGVEPVNVASYSAALVAGKPVHTFRNATIADGLAVPVVGTRAFDVARRYVDSTVVVSERNITVAMLKLIEMESLVVEGGGAIALAAIMPNGPLHEHVRGKRVVIPLCGGNVDITTVGRVIDRGLAIESRLVRFKVVVTDRPGGIANVTAILKDTAVSIMDIFHERAWLDSNTDQVMIKFVVATNGEDHTQSMFRSLQDNGYMVEKDDYMTSSYALP